MRPTERLAGNPTGAGDACLAALAADLAHGSSRPDQLRTAVAWSAGAVHAPYAGDVDDEAAHRSHRKLMVEDVHATDSHG